MAKTKLEATTDDVHDMHVAIDKARGKSVTVSKAALGRIMRDHGKLLTKAAGEIE